MISCYPMGIHNIYSSAFVYVQSLSLKEIVTLVGDVVMRHALGMAPRLGLNPSYQEIPNRTKPPGSAYTEPYRARAE